MGSRRLTHLLDTHAWIQRAADEALPPLVHKTLIENAETLAIADVSLWEAGKLIELGRLTIDLSLSDFFREAISPELTVLPITPAVVERATTLAATGFHKDPADRLIAATALVHGLCLITDDARIRARGKTPTLWRTQRK